MFFSATYSTNIDILFFEQKKNIYKHIMLILDLFILCEHEASQLSLLSRIRRLELQLFWF